MRNANCNHSEELHTMKNYKHRDTYRPTEGGRGETSAGPMLCLTSRDEDFKLSLAARTRERAEAGRPTTRRPWWGVSRGLSGDFMYITIPEAGTRAVRFWLTGRRSRRSRVVRATRLAECMRERVEKRVRSLSERKTVCHVPFFSFFSSALVACVYNK